MRVITGTAKGHKLKSPKGLNTRPTLERIKESLFNVIGNIDNNATALDLYSGSGSIGIEFLSRGARECYFIDNSNECVNIIKENLISTKLYDKAHVYKNNVLYHIKVLGKKGKKFDFIFMDPPYRKGLVLKTIEEIHKWNILNNGGIIIVEHENGLLLDDCIFDYFRINYKNYGDKAISFYK